MDNRMTPIFLPISFFTIRYFNGGFCLNPGRGVKRPALRAALPARNVGLIVNIKSSPGRGVRAFYGKESLTPLPGFDYFFALNPTFRAGSTARGAGLLTPLLGLRQNPVLKYFSYTYAIVSAGVKAKSSIKISYCKKRYG